MAYTVPMRIKDIYIFLQDKPDLTVHIPTGFLVVHIGLFTKNTDRIEISFLPQEDVDTKEISEKIHKMNDSNETVYVKYTDVLNPEDCFYSTDATHFISFDRDRTILEERIFEKHFGGINE